MSLQSFDESRFRAQVSATLGKLQTILDNTRAPQYPADVPVSCSASASATEHQKRERGAALHERQHAHSFLSALFPILLCAYSLPFSQHVYDDKYGLVEFLANTSIAAGHECLAQLGVTAPMMAQLVGWARDRSVTLRFKGEEECIYLRETTREVESPKVVTESSLFGKSSTKVVTKITEHHWQFTSSWQLSAFVGTGSGAGERVQLLSRAGGSCEIVTSHNVSPPRVASRVVSPIDVRITWLLERTTSEMLPRFTIERASTACRTPRRNPQTEEAISFWRDFFAWTKRVHGYLLNELAPIHANHGLDIRAINDEQLFVPVAALFEQGKKGAPIAQHLKALPDPKAPKPLPPGGGDEKEEESAAASAAGSVVPAAVGSSLLPVGDVNRFLSEQRRSLAAKTAELSKVFPTREAGKLLTQVEAGVLVVMLHVQRLGQSFADGVDYIELMLRRQLIAAVGKELTPLDFANYMRFHNRKLYRAGFEPRPFCYAIRRPAHYPEGTLSIEAVTHGEVAGQNAEPIVSHVRQVAPTWPMKFALNAATNVTFRGERYLHGYISQQFSGGGAASLSLIARARQFSSFLVLVGTLGGAELFQPKHAILVQNKDELTIPLNLETIPSAGEFRDAIESLSPEQQRFAKAIRSMQLEGSMFGVLVIQIKPQLEKLLRLPFDSLTKEIQLTQDLMELFVKYSIPSDQLAYSGEESASQETKLAQVQRQVDRFHKLVQETKDKELAERVQEAQYNVADLVANHRLENLEVAAMTRSDTNSRPICPRRRAKC
jgi:hypothetical protein